MKKSRCLEGVPHRALVKELKLDKSTVSRRVNAAIELGYIVNAEERRGRPARLKTYDPLPDEEEILPLPEAISSVHGSDDSGLIEKEPAEPAIRDLAEDEANPDLPVNA